MATPQPLLQAPPDLEARQEWKKRSCKGSFKRGLRVPLKEPIRVPVKEPRRVPLQEPIRAPLKELIRVPFKEPIRVPSRVPTVGCLTTDAALLAFTGLSAGFVYLFKGLWRFALTTALACRRCEVAGRGFSDHGRCSMLGTGFCSRLLPWGSK